MLTYSDFKAEMTIRIGYIEQDIKRIQAMNPTQDSEEIYVQMEDMAGQIEKLSYHLREILTSYHLQLQFKGLKPSYDYLNNPPNITIKQENRILIVTLDGILPVQPKGGAFYLNGKLEDAILGYRQKEKLTNPLFLNKCGLVFYHHYDIERVGYRHLRDFDNLEKRTITNVLARHFMVDDNPLAAVCIDILVPDTSTYTEVKICSLADFKRLILESDI